MRKGFKVGLVALVSVLFVGLVSATALGATISKTVDVVFKGIIIVVNGRQIQTDAEPLVYQDRTYVPIRAVAEAMGADVSWDPEKNQVVINGRVSVSVDTAPGLYCLVDDYCEYQFHGVVVNGSGREIKQVSISCQAIDTTGKAVDGGAWTLVGSVPPGSMAFTVKAERNVNLTKTSELAPKAECKIVNALY